MKKILYTTAIAVVLDLGAMNIPDMSTEGMSATIAKLEAAAADAMEALMEENTAVQIASPIAPLAATTSLETQYNKLLDVTRKHKKALNESEKAAEEVEKNSKSLKKLQKEIDTLKKALETCANTNLDEVHQFSLQIGSIAAFHEVLKVSRKQNGREKTAADNLKNKLGLGDDYEIRIMDAQSMVNGMSLPNREKSKFLHLLGAGEEETMRYIEAYLDKKCDYDNIAFKKIVMENILKGCRGDKAYRDTFITLFASVAASKSFLLKKFFDLLGARILPDSRRLNFVSGEKSSSEGNKIILDCADSTHSTLHDSSLTIKGFHNGFYTYSSDMSHTLFHEAGHSISAVFAHFASEASTIKVISKLIARSVNVKSDTFLKMMSEGLQEKFKSIVGKTLDLETVAEKNSDGFNEFASAIQQPEIARALFSGNTIAERAAKIALKRSSEEVVKYQFNNTKEIFQIMGIMILEDGDKKILCINPFSDFALSLKQGIPPRWGHVVPGSGFYDTTDFVKYSKTEAYDALCDVFLGSTTEDEISLTENATTGCWGTVKKCWNWLSSLFRKKQ